MAVGFNFLLPREVFKIPDACYNLRFVPALMKHAFTHVVTYCILCSWERLAPSLERRDAERIISRLAPLAALKQKVQDRSRLFPCPQAATRLLSFSADLSTKDLASLPSVIYLFIGKPGRSRDKSGFPHASLPLAVWSSYFQRSAECLRQASSRSDANALSTSNQNMFGDDLTVVNTLRDLTYMRAPLTQAWLDALAVRLARFDYSDQNVRNIEFLVSTLHSVRQRGNTEFSARSEDGELHLSNSARQALWRIFANVVEHCVKSGSFNSVRLIPPMVALAPDMFSSSPDALSLVVKYYKSLLDPHKFAVGAHLLRTLCVLDLLSQDILDDFHRTFTHDLERFARNDYSKRETLVLDRLHTIALCAKINNLELREFSSFLSPAHIEQDQRGSYNYAGMEASDVFKSIMRIVEERTRDGSNKLSVRHATALPNGLIPHVFFPDDDVRTIIEFYRDEMRGTNALRRRLFEKAGWRVVCIDSRDSSEASLRNKLHFLRGDASEASTASPTSSSLQAHVEVSPSGISSGTSNLSNGATSHGSHVEGSSTAGELNDQHLNGKSQFNHGVSVEIPSSLQQPSEHESADGVSSRGHRHRMSASVSV